MAQHRCYGASIMAYEISVRSCKAVVKAVPPGAIHLCEPVQQFCLRVEYVRTQRPP